MDSTVRASLAVSWRPFSEESSGKAQQKFSSWPSPEDCSAQLGFQLNPSEAAIYRQSGWRCQCCQQVGLILLRGYLPLFAGGDFTFYSPQRVPKTPYKKELAGDRTTACQNQTTGGLQSREAHRAFHARTHRGVPGKTKKAGLR